MFAIDWVDKYVHCSCYLDVDSLLASSDVLTGARTFLEALVKGATPQQLRDGRCSAVYQIIAVMQRRDRQTENRNAHKASYVLSSLHQTPCTPTN